MISALINYIKGYVDFYIEGADIERFLTYCAAEGIEIVSPKKEGYRLFGKVYAKDYKKLKLPARKNGLKLKIIKY